MQGSKELIRGVEEGENSGGWGEGGCIQVCGGSSGFVRGFGVKDTEYLLWEYMYQLSGCVFYLFSSYRIVRMGLFNLLGGTYWVVYRCGKGFFGKVGSFHIELTF